MQKAVAELEAEQTDLEQILRGLTRNQWFLPATAEWDVRDEVSHLADTNEICIDTVTGGPRNLNEEAARFESPEAFTEWGCEKGRAMEPVHVLQWYRDTARQSREALLACEPTKRVPWGLGMSARMMATARLMETWAHGFDVRKAIGMGPSVTPRLRSIAFLTLRAIPYAVGIKGGKELVPGSLRAELTYGDETWRLGPDDADNVITGDALEFCVVGINRVGVEDSALKATGPLAEQALANLRAFL